MYLNLIENSFTKFQNSPIIRKFYFEKNASKIIEYQNFNIVEILYKNFEFPCIQHIRILSEIKHIRGFTKFTTI